ncbi:MAG: hypothetical protein J1F16_01290 [Muribaculaceae bacterium]|nr:hypothetical protein [Muribaculaceae bacterium]
MELSDLKKDMSILEQVLAKSNEKFVIDISVSETAQTKLAKVYKQNVRNCLLVSIIPVVLLVSGSNTETFPLYLKIFLLVYLLLAASWYVFLWNKTEKINIISLTPVSLLTATSKLKLYTLAGEIFFIVGLTVFFSLFLTNLWDFSPLSFGLVIGTLLFGITFTLTFYVPKLRKIFNEMESLK